MRVCNSGENNSLKERPKKYSNKGTNLQISKMETHIKIDRHTDGQKYIQTDIRTDDRTDGRTDKLTEILTDGKFDGRKNGQTTG